MHIYEIYLFHLDHGITGNIWFIFFTHAYIFNFFLCKFINQKKVTVLKRLSSLVTITCVLSPSPFRISYSLLFIERLHETHENLFQGILFCFIRRMCFTLWSPPWQCNPLKKKSHVIVIQVFTMYTHACLADTEHSLKIYWYQESTTWKLFLGNWIVYQWNNSRK